MGIKDDQGGEHNQDITEEMDAYYQDGSKSSNGSTILYGLFALVVTLIVAAGLFFGGRAVYRALTGTSSDEATTVEQEDQSSSDSEEQNSQDTDNVNGTGQTPGVSSDSPNGGGGEGDSEEGQSDGESSGSIPSTGDSLPATGSPSGM